MQAAMKERVIHYLLIACCLGGAVLSAVSLHSHYGTSATEYCDLSTTFNCDLVNRSVYSELFGVPVALLGLLGYLLLFGLSLRAHAPRMALRLAASIAGFGFALYLAYVEAYVLAVWCLLCIGSLTMISAITVLSGVALWRTAKAKGEIHASR